MAKLEKQKQKILFLMQLLLERTDEEHPVTMAEIIASPRIFISRIPSVINSLQNIS